MSVRSLVACALALASLGGCQLTSTWDDSSPKALVVEPWGRGTVPGADGGRVDAGPEVLPHPMGCGDRRGPGARHRDTLAQCPLPTGADLVADGGTLPAGEPVLVLGDDVLLISPGASSASLFDLFVGREKARLTLAGTFVAGSAVGNATSLCLLVVNGGTQLQCFSRSLGTSLWMLPLAFGAITVEDLLLSNDTLWLSYARLGGGELVAVNMTNGRVLWRRARLDATGHLVRVGDHLVGYDEQPCVELANPAVCLRAIDALTGAVRATSSRANNHHFVWQHGTRALFSDDTEFLEYDASTSTFRDVSAELAPLLTALGTTRLFPEGEPLADGRVLVTATIGGLLQLVVVDPVALTFRALGVPSTLHLRIHGDVLVTDAAVVSLSSTPAPSVTPRLWFGIFGFQTGSSIFARKLQ